MTTIAIHEAPAIVCPDWCTVTQEDHVADLPNMDGFVIHWSASNGLVRHSRAAYIDNTPDPQDVRGHQTLHDILRGPWGPERSMPAPGDCKRAVDRRNGVEYNHP